LGQRNRISIIVSGGIGGNKKPAVGSTYREEARMGAIAVIAAAWQIRKYALSNDVRSARGSQWIFILPVDNIPIVA
jgi:hypothetical protein